MTGADPKRYPTTARPSACLRSGANSNFYLFHCSFFYDQSQWGGCFYPTQYHFSLLLRSLYVIAIAFVEHFVR